MEKRAMATAIALSEPSRSSFASLWPAPARSGDIEASPFSAVVNVIHPDENEALAMARSCAPSGAAISVHTSAEAFAQSAEGDRAGCVIFHVRFARAQAWEPADDSVIPRTRLPLIVIAER